MIRASRPVGGYGGRTVRDRKDADFPMAASKEGGERLTAMMPRRARALLFSTTLIALVLAGPASARRPGSRSELARIHGKIQFVGSFPDFKVQVVTAFPDLKVKRVASFPDSPGLWQVVDSFPDFKIQVVESFPDFKIQYVESFPGVAR